MPIDNKLVEKLRNNDPTLTNLSIKKSHLSESDVSSLVQALDKNIHLISLTLQECALNETSAKVLAEALKHNTTLHTLDLMHNKLGAKGAMALAEMLKHNTRLTSLELGHNVIGPEGAKSLGQALEYNTTIVKLGLSENKIGLEGAKAISQMLARNSTIRNIDLWCNEIGIEGGELIAQALEKNSILTILNLAENKLSDEGMKTTGQMLAKNATLKILFLGDNLITARGIEHLVQGLKKNSTLGELYIGANDIGDKGLETLMGALKDKSNLSALDVSSNGIEQGMSSLINLLKDNYPLAILNIADNNFGIPMLKEFMKAIKNNMSLNTLWFHGNDTDDYRPRFYETDVVKQITNYVLRNSSLLTELTTAIDQGQLNNVKKLMKTKKISANAVGNESELSLAHHAARSNSHHILAWLIEQGADIHNEDIKGNTPLHLAVKKGHKAAVELLIKHGAKGYIRNYQGEAALTRIDCERLALEISSESLAYKPLSHQSDSLITAACSTLTSLSKLSLSEPVKETENSSYPNNASLIETPTSYQIKITSTERESCNSMQELEDKTRAQHQQII